MYFLLCTLLIEDTNVDHIYIYYGQSDCTTYDDCMLIKTSVHTVSCDVSHTAISHYPPCIQKEDRSRKQRLCKPTAFFKKSVILCEIFHHKVSIDVRLCVVREPLLQPDRTWTWAARIIILIIIMIMIKHILVSRSWISKSATFSLNLIPELFRKSVEKTHVSLKSDKTNGYLTCRRFRMYDSI